VGTRTPLMLTIIINIIFIHREDHIAYVQIVFAQDLFDSDGIFMIVTYKTIIYTHI